MTVATPDPQTGRERMTARSMMVDSQVRPNKVTDARIIAAMRSLPREAFLPPALATRAYCDEDVALGSGRIMPQPMTIARLLQEAALRTGERVLIVAAGTGYGAAVASLCGATVTALEQDPALLAIARGALATHAPDVRLAEGPLAAGWPDMAPYDCIIVEGAVDDLPPVLAVQLDGSGRLVMVRSLGENQTGHAVVGRTSGGRLSFRTAFDCAMPSLPAMRKGRGFVF